MYSLQKWIEKCSSPERTRVHRRSHRKLTPLSNCKILHAPFQTSFEMDPVILQFLFTPLPPNKVHSIERFSFRLALLFYFRSPDFSIFCDAFNTFICLSVLPSILFVFSFPLLSIRLLYEVPDKISDSEIFSRDVCLPQKLVAVGLLLPC